MGGTAPEARGWEGYLGITCDDNEAVRVAGADLRFGQQVRQVGVGWVAVCGDPATMMK